MEYENPRKFESVFSKKVRAGRRRTYFFDVRRTKGDDYYLTLTESTRRINGDGYERHKIFLYKEDFNRFQNGLSEAVNHIKTELMPDYDYEEFDRREVEWEAKRAAEAEAEANGETMSTTETTTEKISDPELREVEVQAEEKEIESEDDISW